MQGQGASVAVPPGWRSRQLQLGMDFRSGRRNDRVRASSPIRRVVTHRLQNADSGHSP